MDRATGENIRASSRLLKFFSKLLGEITHFNADILHFQPSTEGLIVALEGKGLILKKTVIKSDWLGDIKEFLAQNAISKESDSAYFVRLYSEESQLECCVRILGEQDISLGDFKLVRERSKDTLFSNEKDLISPTTELKGNSSEDPLIYLAEDNADQRIVLEMALQSFSYRVESAEDGERILLMLEKRIPDLIVTDLMMPKLDGLELIKRLKADPRYAAIPVLVLTAVSDSDKEYSLLSLGVEDYCEKTVRKQILLQRITNILKRSQSNKSI